jgi:hypothetical protein
MKPRGQAEQAGLGKGVAVTQRKKQPSTTSAAGRKIARKIVYNLIERRRRSKMKEEFGVLKSMIPACTNVSCKSFIIYTLPSP